MVSILNQNAVVDSNYTEVESIKCNCCGKQAIVATRNESICQACEQEMYDTISGYEVEEYNELKEAHIGKVEMSFDDVVTRLMFGDRFVIRMNSKFYGWQWKAAKLFEKELAYAREFETKEQAEKIAQKYVNQCTEYQILTINQAMSM